MKHKIVETPQGKVVIGEYSDIKDNSWYYIEGKVLQFTGRKVLGDKIIAYPIIATINFSLDKDCPMVFVEDEAERLACRKYTTSIYYIEQVEAFIEGYKASQQKGVYSEEDLREVVKMVLEDAKKSVIWSETYHNPLSDRIIPLLNQEYIELETECSYGDDCPSEGAYDRQDLCNVIIKANRNTDSQLIAYTKKD